MSDLSGKVAWVTGGARGIGAAVADELRRAGASVHVTDRTRDGDVDACDMRDPTAISEYVHRLVFRVGRLDILVNNAAVQRRRPFVAFDEGDFDAIFETNVRGAFFAAQAVAKAMVERKSGGSIINVSSVNAKHAQPETALYCASKGAIRTMTRALAVSLGRYGIRVNAVAPGTIETDLNRDRLADDETSRQIIEATPLGRLGVPMDVAPAVAFLASDDARFITGASVAIHGGWTLSG
ncbi:MAG: SDR family oxidoreductase [Caldimonas sp.]